MGFVVAENMTDERCGALTAEGNGLTRYRWRTGLLPYICPLIARKFDFETASVVLNVLTQVTCGPCPSLLDTSIQTYVHSDCAEDKVDLIRSSLAIVSSHQASVHPLFP